MSGLQLPMSDGGGRFPGAEAISQAPHWDAATTAVVMARLGPPTDIAFFTTAEEATARALFDELLDQHTEPRVPVVNLVDRRLSAGQTDGWHFADLPADPEAWRRSLAGLDEDAHGRHGTAFAACAPPERRAMLQELNNLGDQGWHGLNAQHIWGLWMRYACTAFYSHPWAWDEIGFPGPAYPRGYKNMGLDRREPFETADQHPEADPVAQPKPGSPDNGRSAGGKTGTAGAGDGGAGAGDAGDHAAAAGSGTSGDPDRTGLEGGGKS